MGAGLVTMAKLSSECFHLLEYCVHLDSWVFIAFIAVKSIRFVKGVLVPTHTSYLVLSHYYFVLCDLFRRLGV